MATGATVSSSSTSSGGSGASGVSLPPTADRHHPGGPPAVSPGQERLVEHLISGWRRGPGGQLWVWLGLQLGLLSLNMVAAGVLMAGCISALLQSSD
jgi:hypothetical protein